MSIRFAYLMMLERILWSAVHLLVGASRKPVQLYSVAKWCLGGAMLTRRRCCGVRQSNISIVLRNRSKILLVKTSRNFVLKKVGDVYIYIGSGIHLQNICLKLAS